MNRQLIIGELQFSASRSSGPGGQHVNKTSSRITLRFDLNGSKALSPSEKQLLHSRLKGRINQEGELYMHCGETRSQHRNKALLIDRFLTLLSESLTPPKVRKKTKPGKSAVEKRLRSKKRHALKKALRKKPPSNE